MLSVPWNVALCVLTRDQMMSSFFEFLGQSCFFSVTSHRHFIRRDTSHYSSHESSQNAHSVHIPHADSYPDTRRISCFVVTEKCQPRGRPNSVERAPRQSAPKCSCGAGSRKDVQRSPVAGTSPALRRIRKKGKWKNP